MVEPRTIEWNLTNHRPNDEAISTIEHLRSVAIVLGQVIVDVCPESREKSLALTNLEQSVMWAVASIARDPENVAEVP